MVGIAGHGMRALADVLLGHEWQLSGSDADIARVPAMAAAGVQLFQGHAAENVSEDADEIIYSDAVAAENPELRRARELGIPTVSYFAKLGQLGSGRRVIAIAGTHAKSTVTAMAAHAMVNAGRDPTIVLGATPLGASSGGRAGGSDVMLVEACEYRRNFLHLAPSCAAILGIELDHFDCYKSLDDLREAFHQFAASLPGDGLLVARYECPTTQRIATSLSCRIETFGLSPDADWTLRISDGTDKNVYPPVDVTDKNIRPPASATDKNVYPLVDIVYRGKPFCRVQLRVPGEHNLLNALAAAALAHAEGLTPDEIATGLSDFPGLHRRLEDRGTWQGATWIDDYAHHPTEIVAALAAVRGMFPTARIWCVFQPHQASRTRHLLDDFAESVRAADRVLIADIFRAREGAYKSGDVTAAHLADRARATGVEVLPGHTRDAIRATLKAELSPGDILVTLGAGDVDAIVRDGN